MGCVPPPKHGPKLLGLRGMWLRVGWTLAKPRGASLHPWALAFLPTALPVLSSEPPEAPGALREAALGGSNVVLS